MKVALLAKPPIAGHAKTRLIGPLAATQAAAVHAAMVHCTMRRVRTAFGGTGEHDLILAMDRHGSGDSRHRDAWLADALEGWCVVDQGSGDLGDRLDRIWLADADTPTVFLGCDSPDVPIPLLRSIPTALQRADVCIGPTDDGGYWTLGSRRRSEPLVRGIDWGTSSVYHRTLEAAYGRGLGVEVIDAWSDVDEIHDLARLRRRLAGARESPLITLRRDLDQLLGGPQQ